MNSTSLEKKCKALSLVSAKLETEYATQYAELLMFGHWLNFLSFVFQTRLLQSSWGIFPSRIRLRKMN